MISSKGGTNILFEKLNLILPVLVMLDTEIFGSGYFDSFCYNLGLRYCKRFAIQSNPPPSVSPIYGYYLDASNAIVL